MNLEEFMIAYGSVSQKAKVEMKCNCGRTRTINREKALNNIKNHGEYVCRSCSKANSHKLNPFNEETKQRLREGRLGKTHSDESKMKMSQSKIGFYQTPEGIECRKKLSISTVKQLSSTNPDKSKRKVLYTSAKNNGEIRVCLSSYEFIACEDFLEKDQDVFSYETQVPYESEHSSRSLDILITYKNGTKKAVEIKPLKRMNEECHVLQIEDSKKNADSNGWLFEVWTEKELNIKKCKEATSRADEYRKANCLIDYASYRSQKATARSKKHYNDKITTDKVIVFCDFCRKYHTRLKLTYDKNVKKNGRFICIRENGNLIGKRDKFYRKNPLEAEGKKKCSGECQQVLDLRCFSPNGKEKNGKVKFYSSCKVCRAKAAKEKYNAKK